MNRGKIKMLLQKNKSFNITPKLESLKDKVLSSNSIDEAKINSLSNDTLIEKNLNNIDTDIVSKLKKLDLTDEMIKIILNNEICSKKIDPDITELDQLDSMIEGAIKSVGGTKIIKNRGEGDCMFHSLSHHLKISPKQLRDDAVMYISIKWDRFKDFMLKSDTLENYNSKEEFQNIMSKEGTWGDHTILLALCEMYMVNAIIIVTNGNNLSDPIEINVGSTRTIMIKFNSEFHYEAIE